MEKVEAIVNIAIAESSKEISQEEYDLLPGNGACSLLQGKMENGHPVLPYSKFKFKSGGLGICRNIYYGDTLWEKKSKFIPGNKY